MLRILNVLLWSVVVIGVFVGAVGWSQHVDYTRRVGERVAHAQTQAQDMRVFQAQVKARGEAWGRSEEGRAFRLRLAEREKQLAETAPADRHAVPPGFFVLDAVLVIASVLGLILIRRYTLGGGPVKGMKTATKAELVERTEQLADEASQEDGSRARRTPGMPSVGKFTP